MNKKENMFVGLIAVLSAVYLYLALQMDMTNNLGTGPGLIPALFGVLGLFISLLLLVKNIWVNKNSRNQTSSSDIKVDEKIEKDGWKRFAGYLITIVAFILLFEYLGSLISIFFLVLALTKISGSKGIIKPLILAFTTSLCCYVVFNKFLSVSLPRGILYF